MNIKNELIKNRDLKYKKFSSSLIPNIDSDTIIGVRLPVLRKMARDIADGDYEGYFDNATDDSFEEIMLQGMVIGCVNEAIESIIRRIENFLPKIDNWSVCDSFCSGLKIAKKYEAEFWTLICSCINTERVYYIRFGLVMAIFYYMKEEYIERFIELVENISNDDYYVKMAIAWAMSIYFIHFEDRMFEYILNCRLEKWVLDKTMQKICESRMVSEDTKDRLRAIRLGCADN